MVLPPGCIVPGAFTFIIAFPGAVFFPCCAFARRLPGCLSTHTADLAIADCDSDIRPLLRPRLTYIYQVRIRLPQNYRPRKASKCFAGAAFLQCFIRKQSYCATSVLTVVVSTGRAEGSTRLMPSMKSAMDEPL